MSSPRVIFTCSALTLLACQQDEKPNAPGVHLLSRTDMTVPDPVGAVGIYIQSIDESGATRMLLAREVPTYQEGGQTKVDLPASLAVQGNGDVARLRTRVIAYAKSDGSAMVMREARVNVPTIDNDQRLLQLPLFWLNTDEVTDNAPEAGGPGVLSAPVSQSFGPLTVGLTNTDDVDPKALDAFARFSIGRCGPEQTLDDGGRCRSIDVADDELMQLKTPEQLEAVLSTLRFQPSNTSTKLERRFCAANEQPAACFDLATCLAAAWSDQLLTSAPPFVPTLEADPDDPDGCIGVLPEMPDVVKEGLPLTIAARTFDPKRGEACLPSEIPGDDRKVCYLPFEYAAKVSLRGERVDCKDKDLQEMGKGCRDHVVKLPPGVCRRLREGSDRLDLVATPLCTPPSIDTPICRGGQSGAGVRTDSCLNGSAWDSSTDNALLGAFPVLTEPGPGPDPDPEPEPDPEDCVSLSAALVATNVAGPVGKPSGFWVAPAGDRATVITDQGHSFLVDLPSDPSPAAQVCVREYLSTYKVAANPVGYRLLEDNITPGKLWFLGLDAQGQAGVLGGNFVSPGISLSSFGQPGGALTIQDDARMYEPSPLVFGTSGRSLFGTRQFDHTWLDSMGMPTTALSITNGVTVDTSDPLNPRRWAHAKLTPEGAVMNYCLLNCSPTDEPECSMACTSSYYLESSVTGSIQHLSSVPAVSGDLWLLALGRQANGSAYLLTDLSESGSGSDLTHHPLSLTVGPTMNLAVHNQHVYVASSRAMNQVRAELFRIDMETSDGYTGHNSLSGGFAFENNADVISLQVQNQRLYWLTVTEGVVKIGSGAINGATGAITTAP